MLEAKTRGMAESSLKTVEGNYTKDGSVDLKGRPVLRSKKGRWTACYFIVVYEVFERMAYYGITSNLVLYLTKELHQGTVASANNVTNWTGTGFLTPVLGAYIADAYLGRFWTFAISSAVHFLGMCLLTAAVSVPALKPPPCKEANPANCKPASNLQVGVFFAALYILAVAGGGTKPNISTIGADQFDEFDPKEKAHKMSFFNWWMFSVFLGTLFANTVLVYVQDNVGWSVGYGLSTVGLGIALAVFFAGTPLYRHKQAQGSPFTRIARVLVAAARKRRMRLPDDVEELHELDSEEYSKGGKFRIQPTSSLRFLNKAAVRAGRSGPWTLCTATQVEETKQMLRMLPILVSMFIPATMIAQVYTLFVKQGATLDRHIGPSFQIPAASLASFVTISMLVSVVVYDRYFMKFVRAWTKDPRGITPLQRIGAGLALHIVVMLIASLTERRRLRVASDHGLVDHGKGMTVPLSIFTLLPQYVLMGLSDAFLIVGKAEFFYEQAAESMKSLGSSYALVTYGVGNFFSSALLAAVASFTGRGGRRGWIADDLNASRLDYYYGVLAALSVFNLGFFVFVSRLFVYRAELSGVGAVEESMEDCSKEYEKELDVLSVR